MNNLKLRNKMGLKIQDSTLRVSLLEIWAAAVVLFYIKPQIVEDIAVLDFIFNAARFGLSIAFISLMLIKKKGFSKSFLLLFGIFLCVLSSTIRFDGAIEKTLTHYVPPLGFLSFLYIYRHKILEILRVIIGLGTFLLVINIITCVIFPDGILYRESANVSIWILGQKQDFGGFILPMLYIAIVLEWLDITKKKYFVKIYSLGLLTAMLQKPLNVGIFICLIILGLLCFFERYFYQKIKKSVFVFASIAVFGMMQFISYNFDKLVNLQAILVGINFSGISKIRTLNTRFSMWKFAWETFFKHPIAGVGDLSVEKWHEWYNPNFYHSILDNIYMDIIFSGGLIAFILFLLLLKSNADVLGRFWEKQEARKMGYCLFVLCILFFVGSPFSPMVFFMLTTAMWMPYIFNQNNSRL